MTNTDPTATQAIAQQAAASDPSTPNPQLTTLIYTLLRAVLTILGALGVGFGSTMSNSTLMTISGALAVIAGLVWSFIDKVQAARAAHKSAQLSALAGAPVNSTH